MADDRPGGWRRRRSTRGPGRNPPRPRRGLRRTRGPARRGANDRRACRGPPPAGETLLSPFLPQRLTFRGGRAPPRTAGGGGRRAEGTTPDRCGPGWPVGASKPPAGRRTRAGRPRLPPTPRACAGRTVAGGLARGWWPISGGVTRVSRTRREINVSPLVRTPGIGETAWRPVATSHRPVHWTAERGILPRCWRNPCSVTPATVIGNAMTALPSGTSCRAGSGDAVANERRSARNCARLGSGGGSACEPPTMPNGAARLGRAARRPGGAALLCCALGPRQRLEDLSATSTGPVAVRQAAQAARPDRGVRAPSLPGEWTGGSGDGGTMKRGASGGGTRPGRQNEREYHEHMR